MQIRPWSPEASHRQSTGGPSPGDRSRGAGGWDPVLMAPRERGAETWFSWRPGSGGPGPGSHGAQGAGGRDLLLRAPTLSASLARRGGFTAPAVIPLTSQREDTWGRGLGSGQPWGALRRAEAMLPSGFLARVCKCGRLLPKLQGDRLVNRVFSM